MDPILEHGLTVTRRQLFGRTSKGIGVMALASLLNPQLFAADARDPKTGGLAGLPHFAPTAKRIIYLHQSGAPSQIDLFDYKPKLAEYRRHRTAGFHTQGPADHRHDLGPKLAAGCAFASSSSNSTARTAPGSANCCRTRPRSSTTSRSSRPSTRTRSITTRPLPSFKPDSSSPDGPAWDRGSAMGWAARTKTCRPSSC